MKFNEFNHYCPFKAAEMNCLIGMKFEFDSEGMFLFDNDNKKDLKDVLNCLASIRRRIHDVFLGEEVTHFYIENLNKAYFYHFDKDQFKVDDFKQNLESWLCGNGVIANNLQLNFIFSDYHYNGHCVLFCDLPSLKKEVIEDLINFRKARYNKNSRAGFYRYVAEKYFSYLERHKFIIPPRSANPYLSEYAGHKYD